MNQEVCLKCNGKGKSTMIFDKKIENDGQKITFDLQKGPTENCNLCKGSGFMENQQ